MLINDKTTPAGNSRFAIAGVSYFYDSEVLNSSFVLLLKFSAENPRLRKASNRCMPLKKRKNHHTFKHICRFVPQRQKSFHFPTATKTE